LSVEFVDLKWRVRRSSFPHDMRAVLTTISLLNESNDVLFRFSALDRIFAFHCTGSVWMILNIDQIPGAFVFGVFRTTLVMSQNSLVQILCRPDVISTVLVRLNYV
jgi:hypothetical protein